jgi:ribose 5-phosphate isomerase RpiB
MILHAPTIATALRAAAEKRREQAAEMTAKTEKGHIIMMPEAVIKHRIAKLADEIAADIEDLCK